MQILERYELMKHCCNLFLMLVLLLFFKGCAHAIDREQTNEKFYYLQQAFVDLQQAINEGAAPGAVGLVMQDDKILIHRAVGSKQSHLIFRSSQTSEVQYVPMSTPMIKDTIFDLASLTKVIATTTAVMQLVEQGKIDLDQPVSKYIPTFASQNKAGITARHLLTHTSGLPPWFAFYENYVNREEVYQAIDEEIERAYPINHQRRYSDLGFIVLGRLVEVVSGQRLDQYCEKHIFKPLEMNDTGYLPPLKTRLRIAPTEFDPMRDQTLRGIVHDENTRSMGGVSGHAGLFSTTKDLSHFAQMLLNKGTYKNKQILKPETIDAMLRWQVSKRVIDRGSGYLHRRNQMLGWWGMNSKKWIDNTGGLPSAKAFGHNGFTGTSIWIDPEHNAAAILLTNAVHPKRKNAEKPRLYSEFFGNASKALAGAKNVKVYE